MTRNKTDKAGRGEGDDGSIEAKVRLLVHWKRAYYEGKPLVPDAEFDRVEAWLKEHDPSNPVLQLVGIDLGGDVPHDPPMLSAEKLASIDVVPAWAKGHPVTWGYKVDGLSIKLVYARGELILGATRGDGRAGENVTAQCFGLGGVPRVLGDAAPPATGAPSVPVHDGVIEVRGEAYLPSSKFREIDGFKSPRNLATGTMRSKDPSLVPQRGIEFMAWDIIVPGMVMDASQKIVILQALGFACADQALVDPVDARSVFDTVLSTREAFDFEMDGLVFKIDNATVQAAVGATEHHPRWMAAVKFPTKEDVTTVLAIDWQVGRTGKITPVARLDPVDLGGATISNATLHNVKFLVDNDIAPGDVVSIVRSGDVIPKINAVITKGPGHATVPGACPECGGEVRSDGTSLSCTNTACQEVGYRRLQNYISVTGIEHVGEKSLRRLWDEHGLRSPADLYHLSRDRLASMFGKNGEKMHEQIEGKRALPLDTFLEALGIPRLSKVSARSVARTMGTLDAVMSATAQQLEAIDGIGPETARGIVSALDDGQLVAGLLHAGVVALEAGGIAVPVVPGSTPIAGKRVYITGSVPGYKKTDLQALVEGAGGTWSSSVSKNMDLLVVGTNAGQAKLDKAATLGIETMDAATFLQLVGK